MLKLMSVVMASCVVAACAGIEFSDRRDPRGVVFYDPIPHVVISCTKDGASFSLVSLPDTSRPHSVRPRGGWGASKTGVTFQNGMIASFNQETDPQMQHAGSLLGAIAGVIALNGGDPQTPTCDSAAGLYRIEQQNGAVTRLVRVPLQSN